jgi:hypothetical protein
MGSSPFDMAVGLGANIIEFASRLPQDDRAVPIRRTLADLLKEVMRAAGPDAVVRPELAVGRLAAAAESYNALAAQVTRAGGLLSYNGTNDTYQPLVTDHLSNAQAVLASGETLALALQHASSVLTRYCSLPPPLPSELSARIEEVSLWTNWTDLLSCALASNTDAALNASVGAGSP